MFPILEIGPLAVKADGFFLLAALSLGLWLTGKFAQALHTNGEVIENTLLYGLVGGLLGARVGFFLQNPAVFIENPLSLISLSPTMMNTAFGILTGAVLMLAIAQRKHLPAWPTLDTLTPLIILLFAGIQLANLAAGRAYGLPSDMPWAINLWNARRHPTQLYGFLLSLTLLGLFLAQSRGLRMTGFRRSGVMFLLTLGGIAFSLVIVRGFLAEKVFVFGTDAGQLAALGIFSGSWYLAFRRMYGAGDAPQDVFISLGSNRKPEHHLDQAILQLKEKMEILQRSPRYRTEGVRDQCGFFLNSVIRIRTTMEFPQLYQTLKTIEKDLGRQPGRDVTIDLDILTFGSEVFSHRGKAIPDPGLDQYRYIAQPLADIAPDFRHPATGQSINAILEHLAESDRKIEKIEGGKVNGSEG
jgi:2-amino-4-hydroxy-6-hydroxymethyldihydropteridine diphosphokinase